MWRWILLVLLTLWLLATLAALRRKKIDASLESQESQESQEDLDRTRSQISNYKDIQDMMGSNQMCPPPNGCEDSFNDDDCKTTGAYIAWGVNNLGMLLNPVGEVVDGVRMAVGVAASTLQTVPEAEAWLKKRQREIAQDPNLSCHDKYIRAQQADLWYEQWTDKKLVGG